MPPWFHFVPPQPETDTWQSGTVKRGNSHAHTVARTTIAGVGIICEPRSTPHYPPRGPSSVTPAPLPPSEVRTRPNSAGTDAAARRLCPVDTRSILLRLRCLVHLTAVCCTVSPCTQVVFQQPSLGAHSYPDTRSRCATASHSAIVIEPWHTA